MKLFLTIFAILVLLWILWRFIACPYIKRLVKPDAQGIDTMLIACRLLVTEEPFVDLSALNIAKDYLDEICLAALLRVYIYSVQSTWRDVELFSLVFQRIEKLLPPEKRMLDHIEEARMKIHPEPFASKNDLIVFVSHWAAALLTQRSTSLTLEVSRQIAERIRESRV